MQNTKLNTKNRALNSILESKTQNELKGAVLPSNRKGQKKYILQGKIEELEAKKNLLVKNLEIAKKHEQEVEEFKKVYLVFRELISERIRTRIKQKEKEQVEQILECHRKGWKTNINNYIYDFQEYEEDKEKLWNGRDIFEKELFNPSISKVCRLESDIEDIESELITTKRKWHRFLAKKAGFVITKPCEDKKSIGCVGNYQCSNCQENYSENSLRKLEELALLTIQKNGKEEKTEDPKCCYGKENV